VPFPPPQDARWFDLCPRGLSNRLVTLGGGGVGRVDSVRSHFSSSLPLCGRATQSVAILAWHMSSEVTEKLVDLPIPSELDARGLLKLLAWDVHRSALPGCPMVRFVSSRPIERSGHPRGGGGGGGGGWTQSVAILAQACHFAGGPLSP